MKIIKGKIHTIIKTTLVNIGVRGDLYTIKDEFYKLYILTGSLSLINIKNIVR